MAQPGDPPQNPRSWRLPRWQFSPDARLIPAPPRGRHPVGQQEMHAHEAPGRPNPRHRFCCCPPLPLTTGLNSNLRTNLDSTLLLMFFCQQVEYSALCTLPVASMHMTISTKYPNVPPNLPSRQNLSAYGILPNQNMPTRQKNYPKRSVRPSFHTLRLFLRQFPNRG